MTWIVINFKCRIHHAITPCLLMYFRLRSSCYSKLVVVNVLILRHNTLEVNIVLQEEMLLNQAHNIGEEALQEKLEQLPDVERTFFHIDISMMMKYKRVILIFCFETK